MKKIVIKIGTNTLTKPDGNLDEKYLEDIARQIQELKSEMDVIIVTSGAIGCGKKEIGLKGKVRDIALRQACAAIGQTILMETWRQAFKRYNTRVAQILLTYDTFIKRKAYVNFSHSMHELLRIKVIPILNENDAISIDEIDAKFGDNDRMSALVASKVEADMLVSLSDTFGLFDKDPGKFKNAKLISEVKDVTEEIEKMAGKAGALGLGGMKSKIEAAKICNKAGVTMIIANGRIPNVLIRLMKGEKIGTIFLPKEKISNKKRWISYAPVNGAIIVDPGAEKAIKSGKNLLPAGINDIEGEFEIGNVVKICSNSCFAKAISDYDSDDLRKIKGKKSSEIEKILGFKGDNVFRRENLVLL